MASRSQSTYLAESDFVQKGEPPTPCGAGGSFQWVAMLTCKPNSVCPAGGQFHRGDHHLSGTDVTVSLKQSTRIVVNQERAAPGPEGPDAARPCTPWGLPGRLRHRNRRWALTPPFHPSPVPRGAIGWSVFCCTCRRIAEAMRLPVRKHGALWCSDFPHSCQRSAMIRSAPLK